jgi:hypothetical protein
VALHTCDRHLDRHDHRARVGHRLRRTSTKRLVVAVVVHTRDDAAMKTSRWHKWDREKRTVAADTDCTESREGNHSIVDRQSVEEGRRRPPLPNQSCPRIHLRKIACAGLTAAPAEACWNLQCSWGCCALTTTTVVVADQTGAPNQTIRPLPVDVVGKIQPWHHGWKSGPTVEAVAVAHSATVHRHSPTVAISSMARHCLRGEPSNCAVGADFDRVD